MDELSAKLTQYNIALTRYQDECRQLTALGFTEQQADKLILKKASRETVTSDNHSRTVCLI